MPHAAFPPDLVQAQRDWNRTYALLAEHQLHTTVLRRRLLDLSLRLVRHPFWATEQGRSPHGPGGAAPPGARSGGGRGGLWSIA